MQPSHKHPGTRDYFPTRYRSLQQMLRRVETLFESYGYQMVMVPSLEEFALHDRGGLGGVFDSLFYFIDREGRRLCLRPDFTHSIVRLASTKLGHLPPPLRLSYAGKVYRFRPRESNALVEFFQVGVELLGPQTPLCDAEVIHLAVSTLTALGVHDVRVRLTDPRIMRALLASHGIDASLEAALFGRASEAGVQRTADHRPIAPEAAEALSGLDPAHRMALIDAVLSLGGVFGEAADRARQALASALSREEENQRIERAIEAFQRLRTLRGDLSEKLGPARDLLSDLGLDPALLDDLDAVRRSLAVLPTPDARFELDLGLIPPFPFYLGSYFALHAGMTPTPAARGAGIDLEWERVVGGGGRFDPVLADDHPSPFAGAVGFAVEIEEVLRLVRDSQGMKHKEGAIVPGLVQVLLGAETEPRLHELVVLGEKLRVHGLRASLYPEPVGMGELLHRANLLESDWVVHATADGFEARNLVVDRRLSTEHPSDVFRLIAGAVEPTAN